MRNNSQRNNILKLLCVLILVSCDASRVFDQYVSMDNNQWNIQDKVIFKFSVKDTLSQHNLFINLRNTSAYKFRNLFLITEMNFPDGQRIIDTLEYDMADKSGKFLGKGITEIKENKLFYKEGITFPNTGDYSIHIAHAMRKNNTINGIQNLQGISDVGFRIENIQ